jgi:uncharacterized membrane protein YfcA
LIEISPVGIAVAAAAVAAGSLIQGSVGFGLSLVAAPVIGLIEPEALPATLLLIALPLTAWMAYREYGDIDMRGFVEISIGRLPGTALAVWVLSRTSPEDLSILIGSVVVVAALLSAVAPDFELRTRWRLVAGVASGLMGTMAAVGGPPLALAYQRRPGPQLRATLAVSFVVGSLISLAALSVTGAVREGHFVLGLELLPGLVVGLFLASRLKRVLDRKWLRPAVLTFAVLSGLAAVAKGLL